MKKCVSIWGASGRSKQRRWQQSDGWDPPVPFQSPQAMGEREGEESEERGEESLTGSLLRPWDFPGKILEWVAISYSRDESVLMSIPRLFSYQI